MRALTQKLLNIGVNSEMDSFKANRVRTFNAVLMVIISGYLGSIPLGIYLDSFFVLGWSIAMTLLLFPCIYFVSKGKLKTARYYLTINTWFAAGVLDVYLGLESGYYILFIASSIFWFIIYNNPKEIVVIEVMNLLFCVGLITLNFYTEPVWDGDIALLVPVRYTLVFLAIMVLAVTIVMFKNSNYNFIKQVRLQSSEIEARSVEIESSIRYAKNIQFGLLPKKEELRQFRSDIFVFYEPRDFVSGDFFWTFKQRDKEFLALGDCTGHGVPGSMVSVLGMSTLHDINAEVQIESPAHLLTELRGRFNAKMKSSGLNDGMDISVVMRDRKTDEWVFSSANNCIVHVKNGTPIRIKGSKMPMGNGLLFHEEYENVPLLLEEGDYVFMYSDGYRDQFGGENGKKMGLSRFMDLLTECTNQNFKESSAFLAKRFLQWRGDSEQIDDVSVIGFRV